MANYAIITDLNRCTGCLWFATMPTGCPFTQANPTTAELAVYKPRRMSHRPQK